MTLAFASGQPAAIQVDPGKQITITIPGTLSTPRPGPDAPSRGSQPPTASSPPARPPFQRPVRVAARADRPQIAVVELGAWDVFDNTIDGVTLRFSTPASDAYFTRQLDKGVDLLVAAGAQVALMGVPCYRPIAAGGLPKLPERGDDRRTRHVTALLKAEARTHPERVFMIYPPRQFCTDPSVATNTAYRWDGVHYYRPGAALTFQVITPQLLEIPSLRCADGSRPTWRRNRSTAAGWICRKPDGHGRAGPRPSVTRH